MTVRELIEALERMPQDLRVVVWTEYGEESEPDPTITSIVPTGPNMCRCGHSANRHTAEVMTPVTKVLCFVAGRCVECADGSCSGFTQKYEEVVEL